jgi:formylglycine-generating enzyme required for sulfatase activity
MILFGKSACMMTDREPFVEEFPGHLARLRMIPIPKGEIEWEGKVHPIGELYFSETEVPWEVFDIWAFRLDQTDEERARGVDAESRPSMPYGAVDRGFGHSGYPAIGMTYHAAKTFCEWLSKKTGKRYRLPTVAEWRYAARASQAFLPPMEDVAWVWENAFDKTHPVGKKAANPWGLKDMLGNAAEWCSRGEEGVVCGGSFRDKAATVSWDLIQEQTPAWNETDPQRPKSRWWLSDAPFVGIRVVYEGG